MLAIIGLFGVAVASIMITDSDRVSEVDGDIEETSGTLADQDNADTSSPLQTAFEINGTEGNGETILGTVQADSLRGGDGDDVLDGGEGEDVLHGDHGDDLLFGGTAMDSLLGDMGDDELHGDDHDDDLIGGDGDDTLDGGADDDALLGGFGNDTLMGGTGEDLLNGGAGDDVIIGDDDAEADFLNGGRGDDIIRGGVGDTLHGGDGLDTFAVNVDEGGAYITDYDPDQDVIEVVFDTNAPPPELTTVQTPDGLALYADGDFVAGFANISTIELDRIALVAA
jgi:Ca2+-binding RTX toxin-like protein